MANATPAGGPGEVYERELVPALFGRWASDLVEAAGIREGGRVLDVACGTGAVTRVAATRAGPAGRVVGLDVNPNMLAAARSAVRDRAIEWREGSAHEMPFPDASFDVVLCQQGLQFFPDRAAGLREMCRVLVPEAGWPSPAGDRWRTTQGRRRRSARSRGGSVAGKRRARRTLSAIARRSAP